MTDRKNVHEHCPVASVAALLSDVWTMRIIHNLLSGSQRFCELERSLEGVSTRTLTLKLKRLEEEGIVAKADSGYSITKRGAGLRSVIRAMEKFGER